MGRIIAIDYGRKRCGVAVTDVLKIAANGLPTQRTCDLMGFLQNYVSKEPVERIVVGLPKTLSGTPSESMQYITPFLQKARENVSGHSCGNFRRAFHFRHCPSRDVGRRREEKRQAAQRPRRPDCRHHHPYGLSQLS